MELLERDAPRALIEDTFKRVCAGEGAIALVSGEAGIGKTAFVTDFTGSQRAFTQVLWGACDPLYTPRPLGPIYDIAVRDLPHLLDLLSSGADWFAIAAALQKTLIEGQAPTILVLEDIHWADEATLDLIKYLGRRVQQTKTLLILTFREDEAGAKHPLQSLLGELPPRQTVRLRLDPLSQQAVETLARRMNRPAKGIYEATRGNPFFVTEVLRSGSGGDLGLGPIPDTVRDAVMARVASLAAPARGLLELASIIPGPAELWLLEAILRPEPSAVDACIQGGFLLPLGEALGFRHELARIAIEESLSLGRSKDLHRKALQALVSAPDAQRPRASLEIPLARLAHHAARAGDGRKILEYGRRAAAQASQHGAHREAVRHYQAAAGYLHLLPKEEQARLLDSLSFEFYLTGQIDPAIQARHEAVDLWRKVENPVQVGDDLRWLSRLYWFQGDKSLAERYAGEAIAALELLPPGKELAMAYSNRSQLHMLAEENEPVITWGQKALELAESLNETEIAVHALTNIGSAQMMHEYEAGRARMERALSLALANEMHDHVARGYAILVSWSVEHKDYPAGEHYLEEGLAYTADRDMESYSVYLLGWRARWLFEQGRWAEAAAWSQEMLRLHPGSAVIALPGTTTLGYIKARQGDPEAWTWLDQARDLALPTGELQRIGPASVARAEAAWWSGQPERALPELQPAVALINPTKGRTMLGAIAYWTWRAGGPARWETEIPPAYRAMIAGDWRSAAAEWRRLGCPFELALALAEGDLEAQREALAIFEGLGRVPPPKCCTRRWSKRGSRGCRAAHGLRPKPTRKG